MPQVHISLYLYKLPSYYQQRFMGLQNLVFYCENVNIYELLVIIYVALCTGTIIKDLLP